MSIKRREKTFHLIKRVPKRYESIERRKVVWISLHTDSETVCESACNFDPVAGRIGVQN